MFFVAADIYAAAAYGGRKKNNAARTDLRRVV